jgi:hypothetical protein
MTARCVDRWQLGLDDYMHLGGGVELLMEMMILRPAL